jgi:hypothetical protein
VAEATRARLGAAALGLAAAAAALPVAWPAPVSVALLTAGLALAPGALLAPRLLPRHGGAARALFALATAPFLAGGAMAALLAVRVAPATAGRAVLLAIAAAAALAALWPGRARPGQGAGQGRAPWVAAGLWTGLVALLLFANPWLPPRSDGWFHAAVALQMADLPVPPEDPYFAGLRLLYFWGYHAWAVAWLALAPGLGVWAPLICLNLTGAAAVILGVCALAGRLGAGPRGVWAAAAVAALGYAPFGWVWVAVRMVTGDVQGWEELRRLLSLGASPPMQIMSTGMLHSSMAFFGDKFLVLTPFALGLAQFVLLLLTLLDFIARPGRREGLALGMAAAAALFIHSVVGWSAALLAGAWWWWALWRSRRPEERGLRDTLLPMLIVFEAVVALLVPYILATTLGKEQTLAAGFSARAVATWLLSGLLVVPAGAAWLWSARHRVPGARDLLCFAVVLSAAGLSIWLPGENQSKFFNLLFLLLAAPAGLALVELHGRLGRRGRALLVALLALATVPTVAFAVAGFATERAQLGFAWQRPRPPVTRAMVWAREHTPRAAVFVDSTLSLDLPVEARRSVMSGGRRWEQNWRYPTAALRLRRETVAQLGALRPCSDEVREFLNGLGRPVFVALRRPEEDRSEAAWRARLAARYPGYRRVYDNEAIAFFRWGARP